MSPAETQPNAASPPENPPASTSRPVDNRLKGDRPESALQAKQLPENEPAGLGGGQQAGATAGNERTVGSEQAAGKVGSEQVGSKVTVVTGGGAQPGKVDGGGGRLGRSTGDGGQARSMTGPRTAHGKRRSSRNAVKHGIFSKVAVIKGESGAGFDAFLKGLQESLQPVGALEHLLVEKLALLAWRYRRMVIAEGAEIQKSVDFFQWDRDLNREHSVDSSLPMAKFAGGLIAHLDSPEMISRCLELLEELRSNVGRWGFDPERDATLLTTLYGTNLEHASRHSLLKSYAGFAVMAKEWLEQERQRDQGPRAEREEKEEQEDDGDRACIPAEDCRDAFLRKLDDQIRWLGRCRKQFGAVDADRTQLELLTRRIPDAAKSDRLLRYEASLDRSFDRTLSQLERLQRMRLGLATLPAVRLELSG